MPAPTLNLAGGQLDLIAAAGRDAAFVLPVPESTDLTGFTWHGAVRANETTVGQFSFEDVDAGVKVSLAAAVTGALAQRNTYEIWLADSSGNTTTVLSGVLQKRAVAGSW